MLDCTLSLNTPSAIVSLTLAAEHARVADYGTAWALAMSVWHTAVSTRDDMMLMAAAELLSLLAAALAAPSTEAH